MFFRKRDRERLDETWSDMIHLRHSHDRLVEVVYGTYATSGLEAQIESAHARINLLLNHLGLTEVHDPAQTRIVPKGER